MKVNNRKYLLRIVSCCLSFTILATLVIPASATDNIGNLEQSTSNLQNELSALQSELTSLTSEISSISAQAASIRSEITEVQSELAIAKGQEASQYDTMKMRIKYMYENGHINMLELLLSSSNMAEFLNRIFQLCESEGGEGNSGVLIPKCDCILNHFRSFLRV